MYRGILELKNDTSILCKNDSFASKVCCGLIALFVYRSNFLNKQINKPSWYRFFVEIVFNRKNPIYSRKCFQKTPNQWVPTKNVPV